MKSMNKLFEPGREQGVRDRRWYFCPNIAEDYDLSELIRECQACGRFAARCCQHDDVVDDDDVEVVCHHFPVFYADGACLDNGRVGPGIEPRSGVGVSVGTRSGHQFAVSTQDINIPLANDIRTSQRAELLASIYSLTLYKDFINTKSCDKRNGDEINLIIACDSMYVVQGITEDYPRWKSKNWRASSGQPAKNLDLFHVLDNHISTLEQRGIKVGFFHVPRELNATADALAKQAAAASKPVPVIRTGYARVMEF